MINENNTELFPNRAGNESTFHPEVIPVVTETRRITQHAQQIIGLLQKMQEIHPETVAHSERVAFICCFLGKKYQATPDQIRTLVLAAQLHDAGKKYFLNLIDQPRRLTIEETTRFEKHAPTIINISKSAGLSDASNIAEVASKHHKKLNQRLLSQNNPLQLDGVSGKEEIPVMAEILKLADQIDAFVGPRPYPKYDMDQYPQKLGAEFTNISQQDIGETIQFARDVLRYQTAHPAQLKVN